MIDASLSGNCVEIHLIQYSGIAVMFGESPYNFLFSVNAMLDFLFHQQSCHGIFSF